MRLRGQPEYQIAQEFRDPVVGEQVKIVDENIAGDGIRQRMAELIHKQAGAGGIGGTGVVPQKVNAAVDKGLLDAFPEDRQVVRIDADANHANVLHLGPLLQVPADGGSFAIAHRGHHGGKGAVGDGTQTLLHPL